MRPFEIIIHIYLLFITFINYYTYYINYLFITFIYYLLLFNFSFFKFQFINSNAQRLDFLGRIFSSRRIGPIERNITRGKRFIRDFSFCSFTFFHFCFFTPFANYFLLCARPAYLISVCTPLTVTFSCFRAFNWSTGVSCTNGERRNAPFVPRSRCYYGSHCFGRDQHVSNRNSDNGRTMRSTSLNFWHRRNNDRRFCSRTTYSRAERSQTNSERDISLINPRLTLTLSSFQFISIHLTRLFK